MRVGELIDGDINVIRITGVKQWIAIHQLIEYPNHVQAHLALYHLTPSNCFQRYYGHIIEKQTHRLIYSQTAEGDT